MSSFAQVRTPLTRVFALAALTIVLVFSAMSALYATESHGEAPGLEPREANATDNDFAPKDYEQNFLWGAAVGLGAMTIGGFGALGGLYWLVVQRPAQQQAEASKG